MTVTVLEQARTSASLFSPVLRSMLVQIIQSHPGCEDERAVQHAIGWLVAVGDVEERGDWLHYVAVPPKDPLFDRIRYSIACWRYRYRRYGLWHVVRRMVGFK